MTGRGLEGRAGLVVYHHPPRLDPPVGEAGRVVFVHGSLDRAAAFLKVVRRLPELEMVCYDRRGYGRSLDSGEASDMESLVADLLVVLDGMPAIVVGHSLGGVIALALASRRPDLVQAVAAFEAPMPWTSWWPRPTAAEDPLAASGPEAAAIAAERFMRRIVGDDRWERLPSATQDQRRAEGRALLADLRSVRGAPAYDPSAIVCPVLVGYGTSTAARHRRAAEALASSVPSAELVRITGAAHDAHTTHPEEFAAFVRRAVDLAGPGR